jgi:DNA-binding MarR family transcriptional regulator
MPVNPDQVSYSQIFQQLYTAAKRLKAIHRLTVQQAHLTPSQYYILKLLWEKDKRPFKNLAEELMCSRATITGIVDNLEKAGLVHREANPDDRRSLLAALTEKGLALQSSAPDVNSIFSSCCSGLSNQEFQLLGVLLEKLNQSLDCQPQMLPVDIDMNLDNMLDQKSHETKKE